MSSDYLSVFESDVPWIRPCAAYVHVPFCAHHCGYCDFAIAVGKDHLMDSYVDAITKEMAILGTPAPMETIYIGGGTPGYLSPEQLHRLLSAIQRWLPLASMGELSIEINPESLTEAKLAVLVEHGVNRISLGAQSFAPVLLEMLDRQHVPLQIERSVEAIRDAGIEQLSLDLIFGVPGQTLAQWKADLTHALSLGVGHLSTYGLTYEKGTPLWKRRRRGEITPLSEDRELEMYTFTIDHLESAGFEQYEISSFARSGQRCRHNQVYWANEAYHGFGMGAARYVNGRRELNTRDLDAYLRIAHEGRIPTLQSEQLSPEERARETLAIQLRRGEGIHRPSFLRQTGYHIEEIAGNAPMKQVELGLLEENADSIRLTHKGKCVADAVVEQLIRC